MRSVGFFLSSLLVLLCVVRSARADDAPARAVVLVHIDSPEPVTLERLVDPPRPFSPGEWAVVCEAPCDRRLARDGTYRINGSGVRDSEPFVLRASEGDRVVLKVDPGHTASAVGGAVGVLGGIALTLTGVVYELVREWAGGGCADVRDPDTHARCQQINSAGQPSPLPGAALMVGGVALIVTTAVLVGKSGTKVDGARPPPPRDAFRREPEVRAAGVRAPSVTGGNVVTIRF